MYIIQIASETRNSSVLATWKYAWLAHTPKCKRSRLNFHRTQHTHPIPAHCSRAIIIYGNTQSYVSRGLNFHNCPHRIADSASYVQIRGIPFPNFHLKDLEEAHLGLVISKSLSAGTNRVSENVLFTIHWILALSLKIPPPCNIRGSFPFILVRVHAQRAPCDLYIMQRARISDTIKVPCTWDNEQHVLVFFVWKIPHLLSSPFFFFTILLHRKQKQFVPIDTKIRLHIYFAQHRKIFHSSNPLYSNSLIFLRNGIRINSQQRNRPVIQKMCCTQYRPISSHGNHQIHILQMLSIQFHSIHTGKINIVAAKNVEEITDAVFMGLVAWFKTFPAKGFGGLSSCSKLFRFKKMSQSIVMKIWNLSRILIHNIIAIWVAEMATNKWDFQQTIH